MIQAPKQKRPQNTQLDPWEMVYVPSFKVDFDGKCR